MLVGRRGLLGSASAGLGCGADVAGVADVSGPACVDGGGGDGEAAPGGW
jgi:hypothetical protein